jgi:hypothetical protein
VHALSSAVFIMLQFLESLVLHSGVVEDSELLGYDAVSSIRPSKHQESANTVSCPRRLKFSSYTMIPFMLNYWLCHEINYK